MRFKNDASRIASQQLKAKDSEGWVMGYDYQWTGSKEWIGSESFQNKTALKEIWKK